MVALENCLEHLKDLEQANTAILGIEGFVLDNGKRKPNLDAIADFSALNNDDWAVFLRNSHDAAKNLLKQCWLKQPAMLLNLLSQIE